MTVLLSHKSPISPRQTVDCSNRVMYFTPRHSSLQHLYLRW